MQILNQKAKIMNQISQVHKSITYHLFSFTFSHELLALWENKKWVW